MSWCGWYCVMLGCHSTHQGLSCLKCKVRICNVLLLRHAPQKRLQNKMPEISTKGRPPPVTLGKVSPSSCSNWKPCPWELQPCFSPPPSEALGAKSLWEHQNHRTQCRTCAEFIWFTRLDNCVQLLSPTWILAQSRQTGFLLPLTFRKTKANLIISEDINPRFGH